MNMLVNQNDFDTYKDQSRQALLAMKEHCNSDTFISDCKRIAYEKIAQALDNNGNLIWSKLLKFKSIAPRTSTTLYFGKLRANLAMLSTNSKGRTRHLSIS